VGALGASADALALALLTPGGSDFAGDLQPQTELVKAKTNVSRAVHERMKPPGRTSSTPQTCPTTVRISCNLTAAPRRDKTAGS
jgi:hypothetical protein